MARQTNEEVMSWYDTHGAPSPILAPLVTGKNPDGTDFMLPVSFSPSPENLMPTFEEWAARKGYLSEHFSGETAVPGTGETTLIDVTVPVGQTWYRRRTWYSADGTRPGRFKFYRTLPGQTETYSNLVVVPNNDSAALETYGKYPAGSRIRIRVKADTLAGAGDLVSVRVQFIKLPWVE